MPIHSEELARETNRVLSARQWTLRRAEIATDLSHQTVFEMRHGRPPRPETVLRWADAIKEDPAQWLEWAGYADMAFRIRAAGGPIAPSTESAPPAPVRPWTPPSEPEPAQVDGMLDSVLAYYAGEPPSDPRKREQLKRIIKALVQDD